MSKWQRRWLVLGMIATLGVRGVYAAPAASVAVLKAFACCATHCNHPASPHESGRCCQVVTHAADPALTVAPDSDVAAPMALVVELPHTSFGPPSAKLLTSVPVRTGSVVPPLYRLTGSLLL